MNQRFAIKAIAALALCFGFAQAHAGLIIDASPMAEPIHAGARITMTQVGEIPANVGRITIDMKNQPVAKVLAALVPRGWTGHATDPRIKTIKLASFTGNQRPWPVVLEEVLREHKLTANLNWEKRELTVGVTDEFTQN